MSAPSPIATTSSSQIRSRPRLLRVAQALACVAAVSIIIPAEIDRWREHPPQFRDLFGWFVRLNIDTTPYAVLLAIAPLFWFWQVGRHSLSTKGAAPANRTPAANTIAPSAPKWRAPLLCLIVCAVSLLNSAWIGTKFGTLPPAYHDEYSYLIQARTFLAGRTSFPSPPAQELFDQIHVLNLGKFASRYFPGTGIWLAPFLAAGHPVWGQWVAGAFAAILFCLAGRELAGDAAGFLAGLLIALSPGIGLFSNLLLAHHPTLLGLGIFLLGWLRMQRLRSIGWGVFSGTGLAFAMLCRPPTAGGFALPYGVFLAWSVLAAWRKGDIAEMRLRLKLCGALIVPLVVGGAAMLAYDRAVTGDALTTPYTQYTAVYTPRHVYGFENVTRGDHAQGPRVMQSYDQWAENLTLRKAAENVFLRLVASAQWSLGLIPLVLALVAGLIFCRGSGLWLLLAAIVSLHIVHLPYWFVGIMNWHYVFETAPLACLWFAIVSMQFFTAWKQCGHGAMRWWWFGVIAAAFATSYVPVSGLWDQSRVIAAIGEVQHPRQRYATFATRLERSLPGGKILVLIEGDPADRSLDFVLNNPEFDARILRGRYHLDRVPLASVRAAFPDRQIYHFDVRQKRLRRL